MKAEELTFGTVTLDEHGYAELHLDVHTLGAHSSWPVFLQVDSSNPGVTTILGKPYAKVRWTALLNS